MRKLYIALCGKLALGIEVTWRRGRRSRKLLDDLKERRGYSNLKEEALDRTMWRARFGRIFGPVVRRTTEWMNGWMNEWIPYKHLVGVRQGRRVLPRDLEEKKESITRCHPSNVMCCKMWCAEKCDVLQNELYFAFVVWHEGHVWNVCTRWFKYDRDWFVCKQAALRSRCATLREWSHNLHPPSCSG